MNYVTLISSMNAYLNVTETLATANYSCVNRPLIFCRHAERALESFWKKHTHLHMNTRWLPFASGSTLWGLIIDRHAHPQITISILWISACFWLCPLRHNILIAYIYTFDGTSCSCVLFYTCMISKSYHCTYSVRICSWSCYLVLYYMQCTCTLVFSFIDT